MRWWFLLGILVSGSIQAESEVSDLCAGWRQHEANPLIVPPPGEWMIADPTFLPPMGTPDGRWHLFAHSLLGLHHYVGEDGQQWERIAGPLRFGALRPFLLVSGDPYYLYYEQFTSPLASEIRVSSSADLSTWSAPTTVLRPQYPWERRLQATNGNPFVLARGGKYYLYFSAGSIFLPDALYFEPRYLGLAVADHPEGPFTKLPEPILSPEPGHPYFSQGRGSIKILPPFPGNPGVLALHNAMYRDAAGHSRSAIHVLASADGVHFEPVCSEPILAPEVSKPWQRAFVYAFDARVHDARLWLYFNARSGWFIGREQLGLAWHSWP